MPELKPCGRRVKSWGPKDKRPAEELFGTARGLDLYGELLRGRREDETGLSSKGLGGEGTKGT